MPETDMRDAQSILAFCMQKKGSVTAMSISYKIIPFSKDSLPCARDLAEIHAAVLPRSPVVKLGVDFMADWYYTVLPREGLVFGVMAYVNDKAAGFMCATDDGVGFMRQALRKLWPSAAWAVARALMKSPRRWQAVWEVCSVMEGRRNAVENEGELLTTGVLPEYRSREFYKETRLRVSDDLWKAFAVEIRKRGIRQVRTIIDSDNSPSIVFVQKHGMTLDAEKVPGWSHESLGFVWRPFEDETDEDDGLQEGQREPAMASRKEALQTG